MYDACRVFAQYVKYEGNNTWDFSTVNTCPIPNEFKVLIEEYLHTVFESKSEYKGWKIPETTLVYPWIARMYPDIKYIFWVRDPRDCILSGHLTDDLNKFGITYDKTDDIRKNRAISWLYQREIVRSVPTPKNHLSIKFEDMVFDQDNTLARISDYLGIPIAKIEMRPDSVGRYKTDKGEHMFDFFENDMKELGYELGIKQNGYVSRSACMGEAKKRIRCFIYAIICFG